MKEGIKMDFGKQIRDLRTERNLTQEEMASLLHVSRQAVSNWENNKNLPDIEMLITISKEFSLSLDQLILKEEKMTKKLIHDGSETKKTKYKMIMVVVGMILLCIGLSCFLIEAVSVEYIDAQGILHENFFLIPIGYLFLFSGFVSVLIAGIKEILSRKKRLEDE